MKVNCSGYNESAKIWYQLYQSWLLSIMRKNEEKKYTSPTSKIVLKTILGVDYILSDSII